MNLCKLNGCHGDLYARGYCSKHYWRWYRNGTTKPQVAHRAGPCQAAGCTRRGTQRGWCPAHRARVDRYGDAVVEVPLGATTTQVKRAVEERGAVCVDCGASPFGGTLRCESHLRADLARRTAGKSGDTKSRPSDDRVGARRVRTPRDWRAA